MKEMARLELERQEAQTRENALAEAVASKKKQLLTDLVIFYPQISMFGPFLHIFCVMQHFFFFLIVDVIV